MNQRHLRIAGFVATCSGVLAGSLSGSIIGVAFGTQYFGNGDAAGSDATGFLLFMGACVLVGAMICCWLTLKAIRHPAANRTTALLLVFLPLIGLGFAGANVLSLGGAAFYTIVVAGLLLAAIVAHAVALRFGRAA